jgi:hypothetical protein
LLSIKADFTSAQLSAVDMDNSGSVNSIDFGLLRKYLLGM